MRRRAGAEPARVSVPGERHARREARAQQPPQAPRRRGRRRHTGSRGALHALSTVLITAGLALVSDAGVTLAWEEPITHVLTQRQQASLGGDLDDLQAEGLSPVERRAIAELGGTRERIAFLARALDRSAKGGSAIGEIRLPRIGERFVVVKGTDAASLRKGPGAYDGIGLPGVPGTAAIAGHRTTYGAPFRRIDALKKGDAIVVAMPYATFTYRVERTRIVAPSDLSVLARRRFDRLVLSACHPLYSAKQRIVVFARLETTVPAGSLAGPA
jgi:sortase A